MNLSCFLITVNVAFVVALVLKRERKCEFICRNIAEDSLNLSTHVGDCIVDLKLPPVVKPAMNLLTPRPTKTLVCVCFQRPDEYCLMWVSADLISFAVVIGIFIFQK